MTHQSATLERPRARQVRAPIEISRPKQVEFEPYVLQPEEWNLQATQPEAPGSASRVLKYGLTALFGVGALYLLSTASLFVLGVVGVAFAALLALLVAVCISAQNNSLI